MELHEFILNIIAPRATEEVIKQNSGGEIEIGQGSPYFKVQVPAKRQMASVYKTIALELVDYYKVELDKAFYNQRTIEILTNPLSLGEHKHIIDEEVRKARESVKEALTKYNLAVQAEELINEHVR